jgi:hypothetical protein
MSPIHSVTLNKRELTRIAFSSQEDWVLVQISSQKIAWIQVICGKSHEKIDKSFKIKL